MYDILLKCIIFHFFLTYLYIPLQKESIKSNLIIDNILFNFKIEV